MKKNLKTIFVNLLILIGLFGLFSISQTTIYITKWAETMTDTFVFYVLVIIIFNSMLRFK